MTGFATSVVAVATMDPTVMFVFYLAAFVCFVVAAFTHDARVSWVALGLALFVVPFAWNALAAT